MHDSQSIEILKKLISFDTTSYKSNLELINFVKTILEEAGVKTVLNFNQEKTKANLLASIGPMEKPGILISGHTDVVPVDGQHWTTDPFIATIKDQKIYGRGTADMKGFIACAIKAMLIASQQDTLHKPLHLCLSYDEEIGCIGVRGILEQLSSLIITPELCIIGEPTSMNIATGHKGKAVFKAVCTGHEGHSALAPNYTNAIHVAQHVIEAVTQTQQKTAEGIIKDTAYDIPYTTLHIGKIQGGKALNIVPNECVIDYEIRNIAEQPIQELQDDIYTSIDNSPFSKFINIDEVNQYPGLNTSSTIHAIKFMQTLLTSQAEIQKISFGTEGGLFQEKLECPVVVCGPGSIQVAHKPDEYIEIEQINSCDLFFEHLVKALC